MIAALSQRLGKTLVASQKIIKAFRATDTASRPMLAIRIISSEVAPRENKKTSGYQKEYESPSPLRTIVLASSAWAIMSVWTRVDVSLTKTGTAITQAMATIDPYHALVFSVSIVKSLALNLGRLG